jgi:hypothetical protein
MENLAQGFCSITAFGNFDHKKGGHMLLWDLGIAVEFPAHSTILIPSAFLEHSNTSTQEGETRRSITQYNASALFTWRANGFQTAGEAKKKGRKMDSWCNRTEHLFSTINDLMGRFTERS